jgi:hypothetical protein
VRKTALSAPVLLLAVCTAGSVRSAGYVPTADDLRSAIASRNLFLEGDAERLVIDACAMRTIVNDSVVVSVRTMLPEVRFADCGEESMPGEVRWTLWDAMSWRGDRTVLLAVHISRPGRVFHRESYRMEDGRVSEILLSHYGVAD